MVIRESAEDYLETILILKNRLGNVRSIDIAHELSFSKPSVSVAMKNLRLNNYIGVDPETAAEDACKIEHVISSESFSALKKYLADNEKN